MTNVVASYGSIAVGMNFNPSGDEKVSYIKAHYAEIIDTLNDIRDSEENENEFKDTLLETAITSAITAQMWAVKAITRKET